jgi:hypothetical protein
MSRMRELGEILCIILIIATFASFNLTKAGQSVPFANSPPNGPSWVHETGVGHIFLPNPENDNSTFTLDVNVTVLNNNGFVQGSISYIEINITIPNYLASYLNLEAIMFVAQITDALQATSTQASTQAFFMWLAPENFYFPNIPVSNISDLILIPYDWAGSNYIVLQDAGHINLTLTSPLGAVNNASVTSDWQQRSQFTTSLIIPLVTMNPIQAPTPTPEKMIFHQPINDPNNLIYVLFLGFTPLLDLTLAIIQEAYQKTKKPKIYKRILYVPIFFLSIVFIPDMLIFRPYDLSIVQFLMAVLIWIVGSTLLIKGRNRLTSMFFRKKQNQKPENHTKEKAESSSRIDKQDKQPLDNNKQKEVKKNQ